MKTAELITLLTNDTAPRRPRALGLEFVGAALAGAIVSMAVLICWLGLRPMHAAMHAPSFWMKAAYTVPIALSGLFATVRLARPGGRIGAAIWLAVGAVAWLAMMAGMETMRTPPVAMPRLWLGDTWDVCPFRIIALGAPVFVATLLFLRRTAPTRLALAGAVAGLFAGAVGATVYGLYCQETTAAFVVVWYSLGVAACAAIGAAVGGRLLRW